MRLLLRHPAGSTSQPTDPGNSLDPGNSHNELARQVQMRTAELSRSRRLLQEAQRLAHVGSWSLDLRRGELSWSEEIYRIFELDPNHFEPSYETFLQCVHPDDRRDVDQAYSQSLIDRQPYAITHRLRMPDGRIKYIAECCETSFSAGGEPVLSVGTATDITEPTNARMQLEAIARKLRSLVELAPLGITLVDGDGRGHAVHPIHGRAVHAVQELSRIGRESLYIATLTFGVEGVEHQAGLARAAGAGDHGQLTGTDIDVQIAKIVLASTTDTNQALRHVLRSFLWRPNILGSPGMHLENACALRLCRSRKDRYKKAPTCGALIHCGFLHLDSAGA